LSATYVCTIRTEKHLTRDGNDAANARLIAAAPEMLNTIQRLVEQIECQGFVNQHEGAKANALLAKIEGRE